ncbi:hypothetical protein K469DRAFT_555019 [Zopfia rhizophila CBS 207.26]|uniref:Uncharacterized protein n=1 Tax=Zopfia rhizophila CBS 207.26 TaxID=1314779 RepID=A0A6A6EM31_9PEZI|nr:hypothetical protein K469DRAFT_555019 [Zopfia rhizophila CBS 207.26]
MATRTPSLQRLLRTSALRQTSQLSRTLPQLARRSPSPPRIQNLSIATTFRGNQWTQFTTPYSLSSVRAFTASRTAWRPDEEVATETTDPEAAKRIGEVMEAIQDLYGTARDEFEIAAEETEKNTTYAPEDRAAAREELDKLLAYYNDIIEGEDKAIAEEVKGRVGQRIRELEQAVIGMEEAAKAGD